MKFTLVRYGWPWRTLVVMAIIYGIGIGMALWMSVSSGWWALSKHHKSSGAASDTQRPVPGKLKLGNFVFGHGAASVYEDADCLLIRSPDSWFFFYSLIMPDLDLPKERIKVQADGTCTVDCGEDGMVVLEIDYPHREYQIGQVGQVGR